MIKTSIRIGLFIAVMVFGVIGYETIYHNGYIDGFSDGKVDGYKQGYADGYQAGKNDGYHNGFEQGNDEGFSEGYTEGTVDYVTGYSIPSLGLSLAILFFIASFYYGYRYLKPPAKRVIQEITDTIEELRQRTIAKQELRRKKYSTKEQARIKAHYLANQMFEKTITAVADEKSKSEVEGLRQKAEEKILAIELENISKIAQAYQSTLESIKATEYLSAKERTDLYQKIQTLFGK